MRALSLIAWGLVFSGTAAQSALSPKYQSVREFRAILDTLAVVDAFPEGQVLERIEHLSQNQYRVISANCSMPVAIVDNNQTLIVPGARSFLVKLGKIVCSRRL